MNQPGPTRFASSCSVAIQCMYTHEYVWMYVCHLARALRKNLSAWKCVQRWSFLQNEYSSILSTGVAVVHRWIGARQRFIVLDVNPVIDAAKEANLISEMNKHPLWNVLIIYKMLPIRSLGASSLHDFPLFPVRFRSNQKLFYSLLRLNCEQHFLVSTWHKKVNKD